MGFRYGFVLALGVALVACGSIQSREQSPLPPLKRTAGIGPEVTAKGGTVVEPDGKKLDLATVYASSNAILVFYRGGW